MPTLKNTIAFPQFWYRLLSEEMAVGFSNIQKNNNLACTKVNATFGGAHSDLDEVSDPKEEQSNEEKQRAGHDGPHTSIQHLKDNEEKRMQQAALARCPNA